MRIIAGTYRSRVIESVVGDTTRPTTDKVKEAIFSRIGPYFDGGDMLDLFAGSGNMSFEAISRGISTAVLVDANAQAVRTIQKNAHALGVASQCTIWKLDYQRALKQAAAKQLQFDIVYLDPPYKKQQIAAILTFMEDHNMLKDDADIICESLKEDEFADFYGTLEKVQDRTYGITRITYYKKR